VSFIHILQTQDRDVQCQTISLGRIAFTYGKASSSANGDAMDIDGHRPKEHTAVVDFSASDNMMTLILERGNPHLEIIDHLTRILNGKEGLDGVAKLLPLTLPVLQGLDAIEMAWASVRNGQAYVNVRAADWYIIRYDITLPTSNGAPPKIQKIMFEVRLRHRRSVPWWYISRIVARDHQEDGIDTALKPVWDANGEGWHGMRVSGVAQAHGVEELLGKIDEAMRGYVNSEGTIEAPASAPIPTAVPAPAPTQPRPKAPVPPPRQQQPTPNHSQNSQGRTNQLKREIVEID
jgi:mediator of RNA polymerase II transcription subunit 14